MGMLFEHHGITLGVLWEYYGNALKKWEHYGDTMGIACKDRDNTVGMPWEHSGNAMGMPWNTVGLLWE